MTSPGPKRSNKAPVSSVVTGLTDSLHDASPMTVKSAGATYDEDLRLREDEELRNSVESAMEGLDDFKDFRRESDVTQPTATPVKGLSDWGRQLTENSKGNKTISPVQEQSLKDLRGVRTVEKPNELNPARKLAPTDVSISSTPQKPDAPSTTPKTEVNAPDIGAVNAALSKNWMDHQNRHGTPNAAKLDSRVRELVRFENTSRNFEQDMDGSEHALDPRYSFRGASTNDSTDAAHTWLEMTTSQLDPRHSFRRAALKVSNIKASVLKSTAQPASTPESVVDSKDKDLPDPTPRQQPKTWIDEVFADYPGGWQYDVLSSVGIFLFTFVLPLLGLFILLTTSLHFHRLVRPACAYRAVSTISAIGPSLRLPDFCVLSEHHITPSEYATIIDPLGINQVLKWPLSLPHYQHLNYTVSHPVYSFSPIDDSLKQSAAFIAMELHIRALSRHATQRVEAGQAVQTSFAGLTEGYDVLIQDLLQWSISTPRDVHKLARGFTGLGQSISLLWGPLLRYKTPLGQIKQTLRGPVRGLVGNVQNLANQTQIITRAIRKARTSRMKFRLALAEAELYFLERCLSRNRLGWTKIIKASPCNGWEPREIKKSLVTIEREEDVLFEAMRRYLDQLVAPTWLLENFYQEVLWELRDVKTRVYGDVTFDTLASLRSFAQRVAERTIVSAQVLKVKMGK